jgi:uncharacterized protein
MNTRFDWDVAKARSNLRKHGISFESAILAFEDPYAIIELDRIEGGEYRWQTIGMAFGVSLLLVAHTIEGENEDDEVIRIISARRTVPSERRRYEQQDR